MKTLVTSCKECKWAQFEGKTQIGCEFDLIRRYKNAGIEILDAYDDDKEFNVVKRICLYSRHTSKTDSKEDVRNSIRVNYQIICIMPDANIDALSFCLHTIKSQDIKPRHVTVVKRRDIEVEPFKVTKLLHHLNIPWRYEDGIDKDFSDNDLIDSCIDQVAVPYYVVLRNNQPLSAGFSENLDRLVNEEFTKFSYVRSDNMDIVTTIFHKQLGGNAFKPLIDKLRDEKLDDTIFELESLCLFP